MKGYKAFEKGMICKDKQYAENTVFEEPDAVVCKKGMHFCANPFDVLEYYPLVNADGEFSDFAEVESLAETKTDDNKKFCTTKLKIDAKLSFVGFVKACVEFCIEKTKMDISDGNGSSGDFAQIGSSGDAAKIGSSGDSAQIGSSGYAAQIGSSGDAAKIGSSGDNSVICCAGNGSMVKAKKGSWITLAEWKYSDLKERYVPVCVKTEYVDGERIREDTFYRLEKGEFVEVKDEEEDA